MLAVENVETDMPEDCYRAPMSAILDYVGDPVEQMIWDCPRFTHQDVLDVAEGDEIDAPYDEDVQNMVVGQSSYHIARIAYLLRYGWDESGNDDHTPILEVPFGGIPRLGHPLLDGNHRLAAAIIRGDQFFTVSVDGDLDAAEEMFDLSE
jgi:hypothetical protein